jgi:hypothetical protein
MVGSPYLTKDDLVEVLLSKHEHDQFEHFNKELGACYDLQTQLRQTFSDEMKEFGDKVGRTLTKCLNSA